jgi:hypothetical protein
MQKIFSIPVQMGTITFQVSYKGNRVTLKIYSTIKGSLKITFADASKRDSSKKVARGIGESRVCEFFYWCIDVFGRPHRTRVSPSTCNTLLMLFRRRFLHSTRSRDSFMAAAEWVRRLLCRRLRCCCWAKCLISCTRTEWVRALSLWPPSHSYYSRAPRVCICAVPRE